MKLTITPMQEPFGALVSGWNSAEVLTANDVKSIREALATFSILVFRGHSSPTDEQLVGFAKSFGELIEGSGFFGDSQRFPEILRVNNLKSKDGFPLGTGGSEACDWHADYSFMPRCGLISFLDAVQTPASGGRTYFANTHTVLESLPDAERKRFSKLAAYHDTLAADRNIRVEEAKKKTARAGTELPVKPKATHPLIMSNPDTGREALYVNPMLTRYVEGLSAAESHVLLEHLFERITRADNVYGHDWQEGDLVMWDNISLIHRRDSFDPHETRSMRQLTTLLPETVAN